MASCANAEWVRGDYARLSFSEDAGGATVRYAFSVPSSQGASDVLYASAAPLAYSTSAESSGADQRFVCWKGQSVFTRVRWNRLSRAPWRSRAPYAQRPSCPLWDFSRVSLLGADAMGAFEELAFSVAGGVLAVRYYAASDAFTWERRPTDSALPTTWPSFAYAATDASRCVTWSNHYFFPGVESEHCDGLLDGPQLVLEAPVQTLPPKSSAALVLAPRARTAFFRSQRVCPLEKHVGAGLPSKQHDAKHQNAATKTGSRTTRRISR